MKGTAAITTSMIAEWKKMRTELGATQREIADTYGVSESSVSRKLRNVSSNTARDAKKKQLLGKCPDCGAPITNKGARFCWRCGNDVRTEEFKLAERLMKIFNGHYSLRDEHAEAIRDACRFLGYDPDAKGLEC